MTKILLLLALLPLGGAGCTTYVTDQDDILADGTHRHTRLRACSFFDSAAKLANARAATSEKTQTSSLGALEQNASGSNVVNLVAAAVGAGVAAGLQAAGLAK